MTKTEYLEQICTKMGIDTSALPDKLLTTYLAAIVSAAGNGGGASEELLAKIADLEARVEALEPGNLCNLLLLRDEHPYEIETDDEGSPYIYTDSAWGTTYAMSTMCPNLKEGTQYTISFEVNSDVGTDYSNPAQFYVGDNDGYTDTIDMEYGDINNGMRHDIVFTAHPSSRLYVACFGIEHFDDEGNPMGFEAVPISVCRIMVNEGTEPKPYKPYKG